MSQSPTGEPGQRKFTIFVHCSRHRLFGRVDIYGDQEFLLRVRDFVHTACREGGCNVDTCTLGQGDPERDR